MNILTISVRPMQVILSDRCIQLNKFLSFLLTIKINCQLSGKKNWDKPKREERN